jgi:hypothetical protein
MSGGKRRASSRLSSRGCSEAANPASFTLGQQSSLLCLLHSFIPTAAAPRSEMEAHTPTSQKRAPPLGEMRLRVLARFPQNVTCLGIFSSGPHFLRKKRKKKKAAAGPVPARLQKAQPCTPKRPSVPSTAPWRPPSPSPLSIYPVARPHTHTQNNRPPCRA